MAKHRIESPESATASAGIQRRGLSMNRPTPDPSQEGSSRLSVSEQFPSWEGLGVGSWFAMHSIKVVGAFPVA